MADGGIKRFNRNIEAMIEAVKRDIRPPLLKGAHEIQDMAEHLAPEDTGDLVGSIQVTGPGETTPPYSQPGGSRKVPENAVAVTVGNTDVR